MVKQKTLRRETCAQEVTMGKNKFTRLLALCMAVVCLVSLASALSFDLNDDGKTDVWDLQMAVNQEKTQDFENAVVEALGGGNELKPNENGEYEIWSVMGLSKMADLVIAKEDKNVTFKLMADIDLQGASWYSGLVLSGTFDGNGHVISNLVVDESAYVSGSKITTQGFFNKINRGALVKNLKLENITIAIPADSKATYVGLLAGNITGEVHDCTTVGTIIDPRTNLSEKCFYGALAGRVDNADDPVIGVTIDDESILMNAETAEMTAISGKSQKVLCKLAMDFAELESGSKSRQFGICGYAPAAAINKFKEYSWQDISGATSVVGATGKVYTLEDPVLLARRQAVVDKMYEICTVEWTPSQNMTIYYYKNGTGENKGKLNYSSKTWKVGQTYRGMPYNHGSGSLERFESWMEGTDTQGRLITKTTLPTSAYYYTYSGVRELLSGYTDTTLQTPLTYTDTNDENKTYDLLGGFQVSDQALTMGETVSSADHAGFSRYVGNDCSQAIQWAWREVVSSDVASGGTVISGVTQMAPTTTYQTRHGVLPVGGLVPTGTDVPTWEAYCAEQGQTKFYEAYAQASRGDALIMFATPGAHSRMVAYDPICIYTYDADAKKYVIDGENSYIVTHEQGRSSSGTDNGVEWTSTCYANCVYTFDMLYNYQNYASGIGSRGYYMPMTLPAFHSKNNNAVTSIVSYSDGVVKSNFYILSTTVDGNEVSTSVGQHSSTNTTTRVGDGYRDAHVQEDVAAVHGDLTGKTVTVHLSNGDVYTVDGSTGTVKKVGGSSDQQPDEELSKENLNGKKIIFIGNSRTYYGKCVLDKGQEEFSQAKRTGDQGYFYQVCKANGVDITVTNFTYGGHVPTDIYTGSCAADRGHDGHDHLADLVDRNYDYVVFQAALQTRDDNLAYIQPLMDIFLEANPNTKFVALVHNDVHYYDYAGRYTLEELEEAGVTVVDWGALVNDLTIGATQIPGGTQQCDRWSFTVNKDKTDGYHPNLLSGYITAQMLFCALTGESAQGQDYSFWNDASVRKEFDLDKYMETFYKYDATVPSNTNFIEIFNSEADMLGIQQLIDLYLASKTYRDY